METDLNKIIIIGNSGSGKTFLAQKLAAVLNVPVVHLDKLFWESESCSQKRPKEVVYQEIAEITEQPKWILEGVFGDLANIGILKADILIFLNKDWSECSQALTLRGPQTASEESFNELMNWAELYWDRTSMASFDGHKKIFDQFKGIKLEFKSRKQVEDWYSKLILP
jgi:adenylate kinase family enzyme